MRLRHSSRQGRGTSVPLRWTLRVIVTVWANGVGRSDGKRLLGVDLKRSRGFLLVPRTFLPGARGRHPTTPEATMR